jgi:hypothetical protein
MARSYTGEFHMIHKIIPLLAVMILTISAASLSAGEDKMVIALTTDDFELAETDVSDLGIGDSETIYTESGKTIDLLRTADGIEIYVDGELLELGSLHGEGHHEKVIIIKEKTEIN